MSPVARSILDRLDAARQQWWLFTLLTSAVLAGAVSLTVLLVFMLADALLQFSQITLSGLFLVWLGISVALVVLVYRRLARSQRNLEATARRIEEEYPELGSRLINLVQLSEDTKNVNRHFCEAAVLDAARGIGSLHFEDAPMRESRLGRFRHCMQTPRDLSESFGILGGLIVVAIVCSLLIPNWGSAANRLMSPWQFVPSIGSVEIVEVKPGNTEVLVGANLEVTATIRNPKARPYRARLLMTPEGGEEKELSMGPVDEKRAKYQVTLPPVMEPLTYRLEIGDRRFFTDAYRKKPTIAEVQVTMHYPDYLGRPEETFAQKTADLQGT